jgi:hypothetical protein
MDIVTTQPSKKMNQWKRKNGYIKNPLEVVQAQNQCSITIQYVGEHLQALTSDLVLRS